MNDDSEFMNFLTGLDLKFDEIRLVLRHKNCKKISFRDGTIEFPTF